MTDPIVDEPAIRLKLAVAHYGIEFFHYLRDLPGAGRQHYPWDFLVEIIDDLEHTEFESEPALIARLRAAPRTSLESRQGLDIFCNRMKLYLKDDLAKKVEVNRFHAAQCALLDKDADD